MVDLLGVGLLVVGLALIVIELSAPGYYIGVAGTVSVVIGLTQMVWTSFLTTPASALVAALVAVVSAMASFQFYKRFASPIDQLGGTPSADLVGKMGVVVRLVQPHTVKGRVKVDGKLWGADGMEPLAPGDQVVVEEIMPSHVVVRRRALDEDGHGSPPDA